MLRIWQALTLFRIFCWVLLAVVAVWFSRAWTAGQLEGAVVPGLFGHDLGHLVLAPHNQGFPKPFFDSDVGAFVNTEPEYYTLVVRLEPTLYPVLRRYVAPAPPNVPLHLFPAPAGIRSFTWYNQWAIAIHEWWRSLLISLGCAPLAIEALLWWSRRRRWSWALTGAGVATIAMIVATSIPGGTRYHDPFSVGFGHGGISFGKRTTGAPYTGNVWNRLTPPAYWRPASASYSGWSYVYLPVWMLGGGAMFLVWRLSPVVPHSDRCPKCGYDLTGNESGDCPECGEAVVKV